jgi:hypothetical protein
VLFASGKRPDRGAIAAFAARQRSVVLSHDPQSGDPVADGQPQWVEVLRDGLTFDIGGLAPGPAAAFPLIQHRFDLPEMPAPGAFEALAVGPGPHLASGRRSLPVVRGTLALACDMVRQFPDLAAVRWGPSRSVIGRRYFESVMSAWLDGGPFPALGLTAFVAGADGALASIGLDFWIGQELRIEPPLGADKVAATRLGVRLVNQLVLAGGLTGDERIIAPDGTRLALRPSADRTTISVWRD